MVATVITIGSTMSCRMYFVIMVHVQSVMGTLQQYQEPLCTFKWRLSQNSNYNLYFSVQYGTAPQNP